MSDPGPNEPIAATLERRILWPYALALAAVALLVAVVFHVVPGAERLAIGAVGLGLGAVAMLGIGDTAFRKERGTVSVTPDALRWNGEPLVARANIREALLAPGGQAGVEVRLEAGVRTWRLHVFTVPDGRRLLAALGHDPRLSRAHVSVLSPMRTHPYAAAVAFSMPIVAFALTAFLATHATARICGAGAVLALVLVSIANAIPARVAIGADAIDVRWLWLHKRVQLAELKTANCHENGVTLELSSGERVPLLLRSEGSPSPDSDARPSAEEQELVRRDVEALHERIEAVCSARSGVAESVQRRLDRGPDSVAAWIRRVRVATEEGRAREGERLRVAERADAAYREPLPDEPIDAEALWKTLETPSALPTRRAASAIALAAAGDEETRARLRRIADALVTPSLRAAVLAAAEDEEAQLAERLAELEREHRKA